MRISTGLVLGALVFAMPAAARAQAATDSTVKSVDRAGEAAATKGAPGTVVPDTPGIAVAPGIQAPVETPVTSAASPKDPTPHKK